MTLFVKRFNRMMSKKNFGKRGQSSRKNPFVDKTCFQCGEVVHIIINCPNKKKVKKNDEKKKKKFIKKKKNGQAYCKDRWTKRGGELCLFEISKTR